MPAPNEPNRRFTFALSTAVAATTVAVGVTAATLLGWFRPAEPPKTAAAALTDPALVYVPIAPSSPPEQPVAASAPPSERLAMQKPHEHEDEHEREREDDDD